jgi:chromosome segregation protein
MIIKKIELQGFKSFPERTKIIFHPGITAIVGPNGTGKSNIVDALLWALGGQRSRALRGDRGGDVIFNGNTEKPPLGMTDVVLSLQEEEEELLINHRYFRSGESDYRLNGKSVRLKDIQDELWKRSIAEKEYFVIEQGSIGLFLSSKPVEKRLLLEEAAGTALYKEKKRQAESKLESSEQNLTRLEDIIAEVSRAKNSLKRQAGAAIRYRKLREKIRELTCVHFLGKSRELEKSQKEAALLYQESLDKENNALSRIKGEEKNLARKRKEAWDLEKSIQEEQEGLFALRSQISRAETDREKEAKRVDFFDEKKAKAEKDRTEFEQELAHLEKEIADAEQSLQSFNLTLSQEEKNLKNKEQIRQASQEKLETWEKKIEALRDAYLKKLSERTESNNEGVKVEKEIELILRQEEKLTSELKGEQSLLQQKEEDINQHSQAQTQNQKLKEQKTKSLDSQKRALEEIRSSAENLENQIAELNQKKDETTHHIQAIAKLVEKEKGSDTPSDIPGAIGLLADLVESDSEHAPLIDIFWKEEAKATLIHSQEFMKSLGGKELKGNFLLLSPQKREELPKEIHQDPRVSGSLKSHLKARSKADDLLAHLQEAVIVQDIKSAVELWLRFPSLNYITFQGDLLLSSGLLKLGQKGEGIFTLTQEIKKLKETVSLLDKKISPLSLQLEEKIKEQKKSEEKIQKESTDIIQLERKIEGQEKEKELKELEKEKSMTHLTVLKNELDVLRADKTKMSQNMKTIDTKTKAFQDEENELKKKIETEEDRLAAFQERSARERRQFFELKSGIDILKEKIKNLTQQLENLTARKETISSKIRSLEEEIRSCTEDKEKLKDFIKSLAVKTKKLREKRKQKENKLAQSEVYFKKIQKEQQELEDAIGSLREKHEAQKEERVKWEVKKAERDRDLANLEESCWQELKKSLKELKEEVLEEKISEAEIEEKLEEAKESLQKFKAVNLMAEEEYLTQKKRFDFLTDQRADLRESIDSTKEAIKKIDQESKTQFLKAFLEVSKHFQEVFTLLFKGGTAGIKLTDESSPLESGVEIVAQPPGKKVQSLRLLSGGEQCLTSLAFLFALFRYKPTPFCVFDEVDAALDEVNLSRFLELMKKIKSETQFIIVTHNFKTMEVADYIYGTTMAEPNITTIYSVQLEKNGEVLKT